MVRGHLSLLDRESPQSPQTGTLHRSNARCEAAKREPREGGEELYSRTSRECTTDFDLFQPAKKKRMLTHYDIVDLVGSNCTASF